MLKYLIVLYLLITPPSCLAENFLDIVINEICWMGTENSGYDEWIEFYNENNSDIDLNGWKLIAQDGKPNIELFGKIPAQGFFTLERTDDTTVPNIPADIIYTGALDNKGEYLQLIDKQEKIVDEIDCTNEWFAGDNETKQTMERIGNNWQTSEKPGGTPKASNSSGIPAPEAGETTPDAGEIAAIPQDLTLKKKGQIFTLPQFSNDFIVILLTGLPISFISSASILAFKRKLSLHRGASSI